MEIIIILLLIFLNAVFAMAEIAIVSSRKHRLQRLINEGDKNAQVALELARNPNKFLSTAQIGITLVGILAGAFGGATVAETLSIRLSAIPPLDPYSDILSVGIVVLIITYLSLVIGELIPKRIALSNPEKIASLVSQPMNYLSSFADPIVKILSISTDLVLDVLQIKQRDEALVSEDEVRMLIREGTKTGVFEVAEKDILERTLALGDKKLNSLMTSRKEIIWLDIDSSFKVIRSKMSKHPHSHYPVCRDTLDKVVGIIRAEDLLIDFLVEEKIALKRSLHKPLFVPATMKVLKVLELFKKSGIHIALVVNEYGNVEGLISLDDVLKAIVGDIPTIDEFDDKEITKRENNSWLVDGLLSIDEFKEHFHINRLPGEKGGNYYTLGGLITHKSGRIPASGDNFEFENYRYEVVDMDGNRVDKVLITRLANLPKPHI
ncbi:HlyC/CorC family transporter [Candidatus Daviesbacteria bacterium]|nr:HlyC/CorC family transporter [Candidatus Daviesbacteria bacterium]